MSDPCIRCGDQPAVTDLGYCSHCHWAVRAELERGFYELRTYLVGWLRFTDWLLSHGQTL